MVPTEIANAMISDNRQELVWQILAPSSISTGDRAIKRTTTAIEDTKSPQQIALQRSTMFQHLDERFPQGCGGFQFSRMDGTPVAVAKGFQ